MYQENSIESDNSDHNYDVGQKSLDELHMFEEIGNMFDANDDNESQYVHFADNTERNCLTHHISNAVISGEVSSALFISSRQYFHRGVGA